MEKHTSNIKRKIKYIIYSFFVLFTVFSVFNIARNTHAQNPTDNSCKVVGWKNIKNWAPTADNKRICKDGKLVCNEWAKITGTDQDVCCGVKLNTNVPFIWNCINIRKSGETGWDGDNQTTVTQLSAFPTLMGGLTKIMMTLILSVSFLMVIAGGVLMIIGGADWEKYKKWIGLIKTVAIALAVLGTSGIVLRLINPNFFGG